MSRFYTVKQASLILGFSTNSIYKFLDEGRLKGNRGNSRQGRYRIPHTSLERFTGTKLPPDALATALNKQQSKKAQTKKASVTPTVTPPEPVEIESHHPTPNLSIKIIRVLIIVGLTIILIDLLTSDNFSILQQFLRLGLMGILIFLTYQFTEIHEASPQPKL